MDLTPQGIINHIGQLKNPAIFVKLYHKKLNKTVDILAYIMNKEILNDPNIQIIDITYKLDDVMDWPYEIAPEDIYNYLVRNNTEVYVTYRKKMVYMVFEKLNKEILNDTVTEVLEVTYKVLEDTDDGQS